MIPAFLTPRIFSLDLLRKRLHLDELHFANKKKTSNFKVPITIGPFLVKNRATIELIDDIMACFGFASYFSCQYDPLHLISKKKKRQKRGNYEHQGTPEMDQMANKSTLTTYPNMKSEMMDLVTTSDPLTSPKGKKKVSSVSLLTTTFASPLAKKLKVFKDSFLQIVDYPTPTMETSVCE